ncbi:hypothetical protein N7447_004626 [Penicillium robsamsonii]|uniref:uncharacterized protein n=1 Tax=Penicillium robsamsonii TaxID=1792511 RepID=UPI0025479ED4|nr:uncharacterized protein N7447_004626 [Penicillium robsamsonii]KAJ5827863.1 hypothetical protein N7447_004626 [Penicillium robsamsonii]
MDPLSGVASVIAVIQLTGGILQICGKYLNNVKNAKQDIQRFQEKVAALSQVLHSLDGLIRGSDGNKLTATQDLVDNIAKCSSALTNLKEKINPETTQRKMRKWGLRALKWPLARSEVDSAIMELESYKTTFTLSLQVDQTRFTNSIHKKIDLSRLQIAKQAAFDSYDNQHSECLPGTRIDLLRDIEEWAKSPHGKCIFWLHGMAGTGKSTISQTVASRLQEQQLLGASFFFRRGEEDRGTAKKLFPTLTEQMVIRVPQMLPRVQKAIDDDPNISEKVLREQFEKLLLEPLCGIEQREETTRRVIVIDALDECDSEDDIGIILRLLPQVRKSTSVQLRILLTSRPELPIRLGFERITDAHQDLVLHEIEKPVIEHDISLYFEDQFLRLKQRRSFPPDWPGAAATKILVDRAVPLFIAAATICRFISDVKWNPQKRLKAILTDQSTYVSKMDSTYVPVLKQLLTGQNETESRKLLEEFKEIVGVIIILVTPLSINSLSHLIDRESDDVKCRLDQLHSVLSVPNNFDTPVRILHLSFRDFLLDHREDESKFWIDKKYANQRLAERCCQIMQDSLEKNICKLQSEGIQRNEITNDSIQHYIPPELKYACRYWAHHLVHFLHWVEAMSLLGLTSVVSAILDILQTAVSGNNSSLISDFLHDAKRFILKNRQVVDQAPLQVYCAGLIFAPRTGIIRREFKQELPTWICQLPQVEEGWSALTQTLEGHSSSVESVAFSLDGRLLASGSWDNTVRLWDPATGALTQTLEGHSNIIRSVAFSPDGRLLASGSWDNTVRLWDPATGALTQTLEGHSDWVESVAFSPDGRLLASSSGDNTVRLWDPATGALTETLKGHLSIVRSVAFSPDGRLLASGSGDKTVRLWDPATGALTQTLEGHSDWVKSVAFSPDGRLLASGSRDNTVRHWDPATGALTQTLEGHSSSVESVAFSPDGRLLASGSWDNTVRLWDPATGALTQTLEGHSGWVESVAFSPDGRLLASGSGDKTVRLWDPATGAPLTQTLKGHSSIVGSVAFSPDGRLLASGSWDNTVRLWDPATGAPLTQTLKGHSSVVGSVAFSPDGRLLVSSSWDKTVRLWDPATGALTQTLEGHSEWVGSVAFSPDGRLLASGSRDNTVRLWDPATGALTQTLEGHSDWVESVAFSPDGRLLASSSRDNTVRLWDPATGALTQTLKGHLSIVGSVAFSPDGRLLASGSGDNTVRLWDPATGALTQTLKGHLSIVRSVAFSPDGRLLASGSWDNTVRLWDPATGALTQTLEGHSDSVESVAFSSMPHQSHAAPSISIEHSQWIALNGKRVLWLPIESRPSTFKIKANVLALGHASGQVSFVRFRM